MVNSLGLGVVGFGLGDRGFGLAVLGSGLGVVPAGCDILRPMAGGSVPTHYGQQALRTQGEKGDGPDGGNRRISG